MTKHLAVFTDFSMCIATFMRETYNRELSGADVEALAARLVHLVVLHDLLPEVTNAD